MVFALLAISDILQHDIDKAAEVLKAAGCNECYVFGSVANGNEHDNSDIDLAIRGLPPEQFFYVYAQLPVKIDLVDLDDGSRFSQRLLRMGAMRRVF